MAVERTYAGRTAAQRAGERRERLLAAGRTAFGAQGYAATTIEGLARAAGVTARHFYEHFASREALLLAVYEQALVTHMGGLLTALPDHGPTEERVRAAVTAAIGAWTADPALARIAFVEVVGVSPVVEQRRLAAIDAYVELVLALAGQLDGRRSRLGARALVGAMIGLVEGWLAADPRPVVEELVEEATRVALGLLAP